MDQNINLRVKTIKVLEENMSININDFRLCNGFLDMIPKTQVIKKKTNK